MSQEHAPHVSRLRSAAPRQLLRLLPRRGDEATAARAAAALRSSAATAAASTTAASAAVSYAARHEATNATSDAGWHDASDATSLKRRTLVVDTGRVRIICDKCKAISSGQWESVSDFLDPCAAVARHLTFL